MFFHFGTAQQIASRNPAVLEEQSGRIRGADAQLLLETDELHARRSGGNDEGLDASASRLAIDGGPDHDETALVLRGTLATGAEDLVAIEHPLVAVELRRGLDGGGIGTRLGLGDRHGAPDRRSIALEGRQELLLLLLGSGRGHRGAAEGRRRHSQVEGGVAPTEFFGLNTDAHEAVVRAAPIAARAAATVLPIGVDPLLRKGVFLEVVLARDRAHLFDRHLVVELARVDRALGRFEGNRHRSLLYTRVRASKLAKPRALRRCISGR